MSKVRVVVVGCGNMGSSHARAYARLEGFELAGLIDRSMDRAGMLGSEFGGVPVFNSLDAGYCIIFSSVIF